MYDILFSEDKLKQLEILQKSTFMRNTHKSRENCFSFSFI